MMFFKRRNPASVVIPSVDHFWVGIDSSDGIPKKKDYAGTVTPLVPVGVESFAGRTGAVVPVVGDYSSFFLTPAAGDAAYDPIGAASGAISAHLAASDPHPTYLTAAEGAAAFDAFGTSAAALAAHVAASDPHPTYLTAAEGAAAFDALGTSAAAIAAHVAASDPHPTYLTGAEGDAAYQPLDSDLTAIAALATTSFGRSLLTSTDAYALSASLDAVQMKSSIIVSSVAIGITETQVVTFTIPANLMVPGTTFRLTLAGVTTNGNTAGTITARCRIGATGALTENVASTVIVGTRNTAATNVSFTCRILCTVRTNGVAGTIIGNGEINAQNLTFTANNPGTTAPVAVDTTASRVIQATLQTSLAAITVLVTNATIEVVTP